MTPTITTSTGLSTTMLINANGRIVSMSSNDPWFRLFRAAADLFIAGEIDAEELSDMETRWSVRVGKLAEYACPAARHVLSMIGLALIEPNCLCDPYRSEPCDCPQVDRRDILRERIKAA